MHLQYDFQKLKDYRMLYLL